jgi:hypothetical protein
MGSSGVAIGSARSAVHNRHRCASVDTDHQLKDLFASFDTDRSGFISTDELSNAMEKLGMPTQPEKIAAVLKDADTSGDKLISFAECVPRACTRCYDTRASHARATREPRGSHPRVSSA